jgi:hypothetical protein
MTEWEKTPQQVEDLKRRVQELLDEYVRERKYDFSLKVSNEYVQQEDWLHLIVVPDKEGVRAYDYAKALTDVGNKLRREEHVEHVVLLPTLAA